MDKQTLRKVQLILLEMLKDIDSVCKRHKIQYFLDSGTLIGAVRHRGFIPWDDDLDIGMLRADYEKFSSIAQAELGEKYFWQTWDTDPDYPIPFGKVRKRGTKYVESKSKELKENGFFIDILPYDYAPNSVEKCERIRNRQWLLYRMLLMKDGYKPWYETNEVNLKKRIGYIPFSIVSKLVTKRMIISQYMKTINCVEEKTLVYQQTGKKYYKASWMQNTVTLEFEGEQFPVVDHYHEWLTKAYGDYMTPPPPHERENRHQIYKLDFGE